MRINWLRVPRYWNLRNFEINFDEKEPTTVIIGRNGSGKSNLFEVIIEIFRELELAQAPSFSYGLNYLCRDNVIEVDADPKRKTKRLSIKVNNKSVSQKDFKENLDIYLPSYIFAYYSGWSSRLEKHFEKPTRKYYQDILEDKNNGEMPLRRLFFCRKDYSQLVLLAFFLSESSHALKLLEDYLDIRRFNSALFVLKKPWWGGGDSPSEIQKAEGDPNFWHARGAFKTFLSILWDSALAPIRNTEAVERDVRRQPEKTERLYLFVKNHDELMKLKEREETKTLFGYLESLFLCDLMDEVRVTVERTDGTKVKFTQLSEGEQQLLTVLGLLLFTQNDESLYLLDEPDTHLNPLWTYDFLDLLESSIQAEKGQLLITTHNPLMIGSLYKNQVHILRQKEQGTVAEEPEYDPIGIGVEGLLKSELYGLRSTLAPEILKKLDRQYQLLGIENKSPEQELEIIRLSNELNSLHVSRTHPNPYFEQFANAMAKKASDQDILTKDEIEEQARLADEILAEILAEEEASQEG